MLGWLKQEIEIGSCGVPWGGLRPAEDCNRLMMMMMMMMASQVKNNRFLLNPNTQLHWYIYQNIFFFFHYLSVCVVLATGESCMNVDEVRGVCKDRSRWRSIVSA